MKKQITNIFYDLREVRIVNSLKLKPIHKLVLFVHGIPFKYSELISP